MHTLQSKVLPSILGHPDRRGGLARTLRRTVRRAAHAVVCFAALAVTTPHAGASQGVGPFVGMPRVEVTRDGRVHVTHPRTGASLVGPRGQVYEGRGIRPNVQAVPRQGGFDLTLTYNNNSGSPKRAGWACFTMPWLANEATWYDFRRGTEINTFDHNNAPLQRGGHNYPGDLYSPVAVAASDRLAVGVSLLYNPLEYEHSVSTFLRSKSYPRTTPAGPGEPDREWLWQVAFRIDGTIPARGTRTYTFAVRFGSPANYIATLRPYADYFQETHGAVAYERDPRPVRGVAFSQGHMRSADNPRGFHRNAHRPDRYGFEPWADSIRAETAETGYDRIMVWALAGLHRNNELNYPPIFASGLNETAPARRSRGQLRSLRRDGVTLGLWWGRSQQVIQGWHSDHIEYLDPNNPDHVRRALGELEAAAVFAPREIGLDAYAYLPVWESYPWLMRLMDTAPNSRFITEPSNCDIMHRVAPTWVNGVEVTRRNSLADLVNPGHETWVGVRYDLLRDEIGRELTPEEKRDELERIVDLGFVPVSFSMAPYPRNVGAAQDGSLADSGSDGEVDEKRAIRRDIARPAWLERRIASQPVD